MTALAHWGDGKDLHGSKRPHALCEAAPSSLSFSLGNRATHIFTNRNLFLVEHSSINTFNFHYYIQYIIYALNEHMYKVEKG